MDDPEHAYVAHSLKDHQKDEALGHKGERVPSEDGQLVESQLPRQKIGKQIFLKLIFDSGEVILGNEYGPSSFDLLQDVLLMLHPVPAIALLPLHNDGLPYQLVTSEGLLSRYYLIIISGVDIPEIGLFSTAIDSTEIGLRPVHELEVTVVIEFDAV